MLIISCFPPYEVHLAAVLTHRLSQASSSAFLVKELPLNLDEPTVDKRIDVITSSTSLNCSYLAVSVLCTETPFSSSQAGRPSLFAGLSLYLGSDAEMDVKLSVVSWRTVASVLPAGLNMCQNMGWMHAEPVSHMFFFVCYFYKKCRQKGIF